MAVYDGTDVFTGNIVSGNKLDTTVLWHGTALPVGAANKVPQYGIFRLLDSLTAPTTAYDYIQTSATLSSPNFVLMSENLFNPAGSDFFGDGSDGDVTISSNTDLGASNYKQYNNLTINSGFSLTGNSGMVIKVKGTLTFGGSTSTINVIGKGSAGGISPTTSGGGDGGAGGGTLIVYAKTISGTGKIQADGEAGSNGTNIVTVSGDGTDGTDGLLNGVSQSNSKGVRGINTSNGQGGGGGGGTTNGTNSGTIGGGTVGTGGTAWTYETDIFTSVEHIGAGGGAGGGNTSNGGRTGGGGGGAGGLCLVMTFNCPAITISANGGKGGNNLSGTGPGGGAGGAGMAVLLVAGSNSATVTANGGAFGDGSHDSVAASNSTPRVCRR